MRDKQMLKFLITTKYEVLIKNKLKFEWILLSQ